MQGASSLRASESGAALLTVLLMVAVMAAVSVAIVDDMLMATRRTANANERGQMAWYARGAEVMAAELVARTDEGILMRALADPESAASERNFPIDGGRIHARVRDGGNCFNLNSVVTQLEKGGYHADARGRRQYMNLLDALGFNEQEQVELSSALIDWIDSDTRTSPRGAEDYDYAALSVPYRTGNTLLADVSELRAIKGYDAEVVAKLRPFVCALMGAEKTQLNVNTLRPEQAALLTMLVGKDLRPETARRLIEDRPDGGYANATMFWASEPLEGAQVDQETRSQVTLQTRLFALEAEVTYQGAYMAVNSLFERQGDKVVLVSRKLGDVR